MTNLYHIFGLDIESAVSLPSTPVSGHFSRCLPDVVIEYGNPLVFSILFIYFNYIHNILSGQASMNIDQQDAEVLVPGFQTLSDPQ